MASSCAGVVLESPIASGASVLGGWSIFTALVRPLDIFCNYSKVGLISRPVTIMHGTADGVVPCHNGRDLYARLKPEFQRTPLWVEGSGHNDMPQARCQRHVQDFISRL